MQIRSLWQAGLLLLGCGVLAAWAAETAPEQEADPELLEFLGSVPEDTEQWDEYMDIAGAEMPPMLAEAGHEN